MNTRISKLGSIGKCQITFSKYTLLHDGNVDRNQLIYFVSPPSPNPN